MKLSRILPREVFFLKKTIVQFTIKTFISTPLTISATGLILKETGFFFKVPAYHRINRVFN